MTSHIALLKKIIGVNNIKIKGNKIEQDKLGQIHYIVHVETYKKDRDICPICGKHCPGYDSKKEKMRTWRGLDQGGVIFEIESEARRIECPDHGVVSPAVPWAYNGSRFTKDFDRVVAYLTCSLPKSAVSELMRID